MLTYALMKIELTIVAARCRPKGFDLVREAKVRPRRKCSSRYIKNRIELVLISLTIFEEHEESALEEDQGCVTVSSSMPLGEVGIIAVITALQPPVTWTTARKESFV